MHMCLCVSCMLTSAVCLSAGVCESACKESEGRQLMRRSLSQALQITDTDAAGASLYEHIWTTAGGGDTTATVLWKRVCVLACVCVEDSPLSSRGVKGMSGALRLARRSRYDLWFLEGSWGSTNNTIIMKYVNVTRFNAQRLFLSKLGDLMEYSFMLHKCLLRNPSIYFQIKTN